MRFALFALVAALAVVTVSAATITPITHDISEASPTFNSLADGKAPTSQILAVVNGLALGASVADALQTVKTYNVKSAGRPANATATSTNTVAYNSWSEFTLGADANYPVSWNINSTYIGNSISPAGAGWNIDNTPVTSPVNTHYTLVVTGVATDATQGASTPFYTLTNIADANFKQYVNSNSSLLGFINLVDTASSIVYVQLRDNANDNKPANISVANVWNAATKLPFINYGAGSGSAQFRVVNDLSAASIAKPLSDWASFSLQNNGLFAILITGSTTDKSPFPVKVQMARSATQTGSPASTLAVSFALMALLAIAAFATPALF